MPRRRLILNRRIMGARLGTEQSQIRDAQTSWVCMLGQSFDELLLLPRDPQNVKAGHSCDCSGTWVSRPVS